MIRKIHLWLGMVLCLPMLWIAGTGTVLAVLGLFNQATRGEEPTLKLVDGVRAVKAPLERVRSIKWHSGGVLAIESQDGLRMLLDLKDPTTFQPHVGELEEWRHWVIRLHRGRFLGDAGRFIFSFTGALFFILTFLSFWLFRWRGTAPRSVRNYHQKAAWFIAVPFMVIVITGSIWNISREVRGLTPLSPSSFRPIEALEEAGRAYSRSQPQAVYFVDNRTLVLFKDQSRFYWHGESKSGDLRAAWTRNGWVEPFLNIHDGQIGGTPGRLVPLFTGFLALFMAVSGFILFAKRRRWL